MKRAALILAALAAILTAAAAPVRTATENFVTNKIAEAVADIPEWAKYPTKPTYTAADVGALPVDNTDGELKFGILTGKGISIAGTFYDDTDPRMVKLRFAEVSSFGSGMYVKGRISLAKNSEFPEFGNGELLVNGTNVIDAIASACKVKSVNGMKGEVVLTASEVGAATPADVTAAIREQSLGGIWDAELQVWWTPRMRNGSLTYEATTNVNLNAEN